MVVVKSITVLTDDIDVWCVEWSWRSLEVQCASSGVCHECGIYTVSRIKAHASSR